MYKNKTINFICITRVGVNELISTKWDKIIEKKGYSTHNVTSHTQYHNNLNYEKKISRL